MNDQIAERILDSFLVELLTEQHPPELSKRIESAWAEECELLADDDWVLQSSAAVEAVASDSANAGDGVSIDQVAPDLEAIDAPLVVARPVQAPPSEAMAEIMALPVRDAQLVSSSGSSALLWRQARRRRREIGISRQRLVTAVLLVIAASAVFCVLGYRLLEFQAPIFLNQHDWLAGPSSVEPLGTVKLAEIPSVPEPLAPNSLAPSNERLRPEPVGAVGETRIASERLDSDNVPFAKPLVLADSQAASMAGNPAASLASGLPVDRLDDKSVVAVIDARLQQLWTHLGIEPTLALSQVELAHKISSSLTGQPLAQSRLARLSSSGGNLDMERLIASLLNAPAFGNTWSEQIVRHWLRSSSLPLDSVPVRSLQSQIASRINEGQSWNYVAEDILAGVISNDADSPTSVFVSALAGGGNHRMAERIGVHLLDSALACARCHDTALELNAAVEDPRVVQQDDYWSLVGMLRGIDAQGVAAQGERQVFDRQQELFSDSGEPNIFFDLPDGEVRSTHAKLPNGQAWRQVPGQAVPRAALAEYISRSPQFDRATVNMVWKLAFGRPLVSAIPGLEEVGLQERMELLDFLAGQFRAHDGEFRKLVGWVVRSEPYARSAIALDTQQLSLAGRSLRETLRTMEQAFAAPNSLGRSKESYALANSLAALLQWNPPGSVTSATLLAQPSVVLDANSNAGNGANGNGRRRNLARQVSMSYLIHGHHKQGSELQFVRSLLASKRLSWEQRVDHIVGVSVVHSSSPRIQELAKELLQRHSGDAETALIELLWAVQNSDAG